MTEVKTVSESIKERFNDSMSEYINGLSDMIEYDMLRYNRTLDAEGEVDEY